MPKLPVLSGTKLVTILQKSGFKVVRQKGSHIIYKSGYTKLLYLSTMNLPEERFSAYSSNADCRRMI